MKRLLLYFSYIGTNYRGLQRLVSNDPRRGPDLDTVQGILEFGLQKVLRSSNRVHLFTSSRTDTKVHAIETTSLFDLDEEKLYKNIAYSPEHICQNLNWFLDKNECDIRVRRIVEVQQDFNCRKAHCRTYEYRIVVLNQETLNAPGLLRLGSAADIRELNRCTVIPQPFDFHAVQQACKLYVGQWDFSTFMMKSPEVEAPKRIKTIRKFSVSPEVIPEREWDTFLGNLNSPVYSTYVFSIEGSGFLRRQVRRMVGALVAVGRGLILPKDILWMLENPKESNWNNKIVTLGPDGLYLKEVKYANIDILRGSYS